MKVTASQDNGPGPAMEVRKGSSKMVPATFLALLLLIIWASAGLGWTNAGQVEMLGRAVAQDVPMLSLPKQLPRDNNTEQQAAKCLAENAGQSSNEHPAAVHHYNIGGTLDFGELDVSVVVEKIEEEVRDILA
ncbi:hypothetical protein TrRE_jg6732 [Triparma retinervis]|uniref:Uncharacterized protein n=1 Tax=Triparma retinervis TaxID=2557542 RepID=A0A9W7DVC5_9STRA|nr:hypothetical protein TrRE_jg6732 [Triparma retinervis]